jgi:hypothetical protein
MIPSFLSISECCLPFSVSGDVFFFSLYEEIFPTFLCIRRCFRLLSEQGDVSAVLFNRRFFFLFCTWKCFPLFSVSEDVFYFPLSETVFSFSLYREMFSTLLCFRRCIHNLLTISVNLSMISLASISATPGNRKYTDVFLSPFPTDFCSNKIILFATPHIPISQHPLN